MAHGQASAAGTDAWRDLRVRFASAVVLAPLAVAALWWGGVAWTGLVLLSGVGMVGECLGMGRLRHGGGHWPVLLALSLGYVLPAIAALIWLRQGPGVGRANLLFVVLVVWSSDIGAYLVGRLAGGPKLAPLVSPGKTWSGALGGLAAALAVGWGAAMLWGVPPGQGLLVAAMLGIVSQAGDLLESGLKRHAGVKDSGRLIPGHGGLLDRLDGMLTAAPVAALLVWGLGQGRVLWQ